MDQMTQVGRLSVNPAPVISADGQLEEKKDVGEWQCLANTFR